MYETFRNIVVNLLVGCIIPLALFLLYILNIVSLAAFKLATCIFIVIFVIFPLIYKFSYKLQSAVVFLNFVHIPSNADYAHPEKYGLHNSRNFYVMSDDNVKLGVWQILPENLTVNPHEIDDQYYDSIIGNGQDVIIYHHGNAGSRLTDHRIELYKVLRKHFHVFTFDYRSYGDSSNVDPTEDAVVKDCMSLYIWVSNRTKGNLFIWAHSLGTSLAIHSATRLQEKGHKPIGIFLEAPFNNMREEISEFPPARLFRNLPWFSYTVTEPMQSNGFTFETDRYICNVDAPIIILHAEDDNVVPYRLGRKLFETAKKCRRHFQGKITFLKFEAKYKYDHKFICRSPDIDDVIRNFVSEAIQESQQKHLRDI